MTIVGFVSLVICVITVVHYYLWRRLIRSTTRPGRIRRVLTWILVGLAVLAPVTLVASRSEWGHFLAWPGFFWIATMFYLVVFLAVLEIPRAVALLVVRGMEHRAERRGVPPGVAARRAERARQLELAVRSETAVTPASVAAGHPEHSRRSVSSAQTHRGESAIGGVVVVPGAGRATEKTVGMGRRLFIARTAAAAAGAGALGTIGFGVRTALGDPVIESVGVVLPRLDPRLNGLRFAVVSDIHLGPLTGTAHTRRIVRMINSLEADVVAVVGDLVDGTVAELGTLARPLKDLESRYGAYFVTGNHEYYTANGPQEWIEELRGLGIRPLGNERVEIAHAGAVLDLAGVNDIGGVASGDGPDFERALGGRDRSRSTVLLAHQPVQAVQAARYGVDLQLSGHTHGGQMVPFNLIIPMQQPVVSGLGEVDGTRVYVTRGAGFWGPPVRVGAPPEITLLEVRNEKLR
ncbi:metallophosphoesterase [Streptosporangium sp. NBC_01755]|uniref:metallophosphoesterase n=1 Tax=unclassified Streptosporangium TaxID=2632669 RepID=UPI002DDAC851|nr:MULTISPECIES: metallophosphoesterase [unclassified Streptosporangium]WSA25384.1 metallophosphoesterase [Streptosporangium sp. NBC_01810]WSD03300.1 metallophosphoesterase [Streptosporangium sp. NBC_01755]